MRAAGRAVTGAEQHEPGHEVIEGQLSDYLDGTLEPEARAHVEEHLKGCEQCRDALNELKGTVSALSGLHKVAAPQGFDSEVAETIRRRSKGRFFGRRTLGDRVPLEILALLVLLGGLALYLFLRHSDTGTLRPLDEDTAHPAIHQGARDVVPRP